MPLKDPARRKAYWKKYHQTHYQENKEAYRESRDKHRDDARQWLASYKATLCCSRCPEYHSACLEFHHIDPSTKKYSIAKMVNNGLSVETIQKEIAKCEVLCSNCHKKLHYDAMTDR